MEQLKILKIVSEIHVEVYTDWKRSLGGKDGMME